MINIEKINLPSQIYIPDRDAVAFFREKASPEYWDRHWSVNNLRAILLESKNDWLFTPIVKRYLPPGSTILEGGCGLGQIVHALHYQGYKAIGVDFAPETIKNINEAIPELDVRYGDVRALEFPDNCLDGYISGGVIEHFWGGYAPIIKEMHRTLREGGLLFITFPHLSLLRRMKIALNMYPKIESTLLDDYKDIFYQYAFKLSSVQANLEELGFSLKEKQIFGGIKGFKDEVPLLKHVLQDIFDNKRGRKMKPHLDRLLKTFASHLAFLVMEKIM